MASDWLSNWRVAITSSVNGHKEPALRAEPDVARQNFYVTITVRNDAGEEQRRSIPTTLVADWARSLLAQIGDDTDAD